MRIRKYYYRGINFLLVVFIVATLLLLLSQKIQGQTVPNLEEKARQITVRIIVLESITSDQIVEPYGSAVLIKREKNDYYVITNAHVATENADSFDVEVQTGESDILSDSTMPYPLTLIKRDEKKNLALLKFTVQGESNYKVADRAASSQSKGQKILVTGFPVSSSSNNSNDDTPADDTPASDDIIKPRAPNDTTTNTPASDDIIEQRAPNDTTNKQVSNDTPKKQVSDNTTEQPVTENANEKGPRFRYAQVTLSDKKRLFYDSPGGFGAGMSGGSLLNERGQLIGIHQGTESMERKQNGQGIPIEVIVETFKGIF